MIEYITSYLAYVTMFSIGYVFGRKMGDFKGKFPILLLLCFPPVSNPLIGLVLGCEVIAAYMDVTNDMDVYDIFHYCAGAILLGGIIWKLATGRIVITDFISLYVMLPMIFTLATVKTRGLSDTFALAVYSLCGLYLGVDTLYVIMGFFIGYTLQMVFQIINCKRKGVKFKDHPKMPFLPALYAGSGIMFGLLV